MAGAHTIVYKNYFVIYCQSEEKDNKRQSKIPKPRCPRLAMSGYNNNRQGDSIYTNGAAKICSDPV